MNKIFKVIWNPATGNFTVASETAKGRGKKSGRRKLLVSALVAGGLMSSFGASASVGLDGGTYSDGTELTDGWIAIGKGAQASSVGDGTGSVAIGEESSAGVGSTAVGYDSNATGEKSVSMGQLSTAAGSRGVAIGSAASAAGDYSLALGRSALSNGTGSIAMGDESEANGLYSLAFGASSIANADNTVAFGYGASATKTGAMAFGQAGKADGLNSIALGNKSQASSENSIAIGQESYSSSEKSIAIGSLSNVTGVNSVALGTESTAAEDNTVSVGNDTQQRKIVHMAKGDISSTSTDAINGSQLYDISKSVADRLGGGASVSTAGVVNAPSYKLQSGNFNNVGDALKGIDDNTLQWNSLKNVYSAAHGSDATSTITNVKAGALSASSTDAVNGAQLYETNQNVAQNTTDIEEINTSITNLSGDALKWDDTAEAFSASHGTNATNKITNVAAGALSVDSTDAVNGSQLYETNQNVAQNTTNITTNTTDIAELNTSISDMSTTITGLSNDALLWDATSGAFSASHGASATSKIINVAAGTLSADSTDAVNGAQLYETNQNVAQNTTDIEEINTSITNLSGDALKWDDTAEAFSASHGTNATNKITNVAAGTLSADSTDAVNGAQLYETNQLIALNSEVINNLAGDTSDTYITNNGTGMKYVRTNDTGLTEDDAHASGIGATAVGYNAVASGASSLALGQNSQSIVDTGIALGSGSVSNRIVSSDKQATSVTSDGVVIGYDTTDRTLLGALSLGTDGESYRQITNVADGSEAQDAVTVRQLQNAISAVSTTPTQYFHANSDEEDALAVGANSIAVGPKTVVNGDTGVGIGYGATVAQTASNGIAFGTNAQANHADSVALGSNSQTTVGAQSSYTAYNLDTAQSSSGEVSVGSASGQRQITNVAAGTQDTDAVNVAQLKATDSRVAANTESITNLNTQVSSLDTRVTNIENSVGDIVTTGNTKYFKTSSTGDDANAQGADSVAIGSGSIASADNSVALGTNSVADEANTVSVGSSTQQRRITNVAAGVNNTDAVNVAQLKASEAGSVRYETNADGSINYSTLNLGDGSGGTTRIGNVSAAVNDTDAVNYAQLKKSVEEANTYTDQKMGEMNSKIKGVENKMSGGIASAMAMAGLPQAYAPGANMTSIAGGTFNGESAIALGVSMVSESGGWVYKLQGTSNSQGDYSAAIGMGFQW